MASTAGREGEITRGVICERVSNGPRIAEDDIDGKPFPVALGTLFSKVVALAHEIDLGKVQIHEFLKEMMGKKDEATASAENDEAHSNTLPADDDILRVSPEEEALLNCKDNWPAFVKAMLEVVEDLQGIQLMQMAFLHQLRYAAKGEAKPSLQSPWETERFKKMESQMHDVCRKESDDQKTQKLIGVEYGMLSRLAKDLGEYARVIKLMTVLMQEEEKEEKKEAEK